MIVRFLRSSGSACGRVPGEQPETNPRRALGVLWPRETQVSGKKRLLRATRTGRRGHSFPRARPEGVAHRTSARSLTSRRARTRRPEAGDAERSSSRAMVTLARAFAPVASGSVHRTPNPPTAVARKAARRPVRASSPGFSGAGGVRGFVGEPRAARRPRARRGGGTDVPSRGGEPKKKRRGKNRRRAPRKRQSLEPRVAIRRSLRRGFRHREFLSSSGAAALAIAASVDPDAATVARFMGTIDETRRRGAFFSATDESRPGSASSREPRFREARFRRRVHGNRRRRDDRGLLLPVRRRAVRRRRRLRTRKDAAAPTTREKNAAEKKVSPPASGDPDLAFLYDADAVRSISMCDGDEPPDVNDANVVARCNEVLRKARSMDDVLVLVREMTAAGVAPAESTYVAIMLVCRDTAVGPARAVEVYDAMKLVGVAPTKRSFDLAMTCAIRARRPEDALRLKEEADRARALAERPRRRLRRRLFVRDAAPAHVHGVAQVRLRVRLRTQARREDAADPHVPAFRGDAVGAGVDAPPPGGVQRAHRRGGAREAARPGGAHVRGDDRDRRLALARDVRDGARGHLRGRFGGPGAGRLRGDAPRRVRAAENHL